MAAEERQGWRCELISRWHRERMGSDAYACDLDFPLIEYATGQGLVAAIIEWKHEAAAKVDMDHPAIKALARIGDALDVPALIVTYDNSLNHWELKALNGCAKRAISKLLHGVVTLDERTFITFCQTLRRRVIQRYRRRSV